MDFSNVTRWKIPEGNCIKVCRVLPSGERELLWELVKVPDMPGINIDFIGIKTADGPGYGPDINDPDNYEFENIRDLWGPGYVTEYPDGTKEFGYGYGYVWDQASALFWVVSTKDEWWEISKGDALVLYVNKEVIGNTNDKIVIVIKDRVDATIYYNGTYTVSAFWSYNPIRIEISMGTNGLGIIKTYDRDGMGSTGYNVDFDQPIKIYAK